MNPEEAKVAFWRSLDSFGKEGSSEKESRIERAIMECEGLVPPPVSIPKIWKGGGRKYRPQSRKRIY